jgi:hypothetical protein
MRNCFLCAKEIAIERRHTVFCSLKCEQTHQVLEHRAPPLDEPGEGRPRYGWPGEKKSDEKI